MSKSDTRLIERSANTNVLVSIKQVQKISERFSEWLLSFHPNKCKQISFGSDTALPLTLDNAVIAHTTLQKDLGITVHNKLNLISILNQRLKKANQI